MNSERTEVVTAFLQREDRVLLACRSDRVRTYRGRWAGISGYLESEDPLRQARREIRQETGLGESDVELAARGDPFPVDDPDHDRTWTVHPFRFTVRPEAPAVELNREHREYRWVLPEEMRQLRTVPALWDAWCRVRP